MNIVIWIFIGAGILIGSTRLIKLRKNWADPTARMKVWGDFFFGIVPIGFGVYFLGLRTRSGVTMWSGRCAVTSLAVVGLILTIRSYRAEHPRSRHS
jgi:hypothetical protein